MSCENHKLNHNDLRIEAYENTRCCVMSITHTPTGLKVEGMTSGVRSALRAGLLRDLEKLVDAEISKGVP